MTRNQWLIVLVALLFATACSKTDSQTAQAPEPKNETPAVSGTATASGDQEKPALYPSPDGLDELTTVKPFDIGKYIFEATPGVLPRPNLADAGSEEADRYITQSEFVFRVQKPMETILGLWLGGQPEPKKLKGFNSLRLRKMTVTILSGEPSTFTWEELKLPELVPVVDPGFSHKTITNDTPQDAGPTAPPALLLQRQGEDMHKEQAAEMKAKDAGDDQAADAKKTPKTLYKRTLTLRNDGKAMFWHFAEPIAADLVRGHVVRMIVTYDEPTQNPTVHAIRPAKIGLIIPDEDKKGRMVKVVAPLKGFGPTACFSNPNKQIACLYPSGNAEFYLVSPFIKASHSGWWKRVDNRLYIQIEKDGPKFSFDMSDPASSLDFGVFGSNYKLMLKGGPYLDNFYDIARTLAGDEAVKPGDIETVWKVDIDPEGQKEIVARLKSGAVAVLKRPDAFSPFEVAKRIDSNQKTEVRVVWVPEMYRHFVAVREPGKKFWQVHGVINKNGEWVQFPRAEVPWFPWKPDASETISEPIPPDFQ